MRQLVGSRGLGFALGRRAVQRRAHTLGIGRGRIALALAFTSFALTSFALARLTLTRRAGRRVAALFAVGNVPTAALKVDSRAAHAPDDLRAAAFGAGWYAGI